MFEAFNSVYTTVDSHSDLMVQGRICYDWEMGMFLQQLLDLLITVVIVVIGVLLRTIIVLLIKWV